MRDSVLLPVLASFAFEHAVKYSLRALMRCGDLQMVANDVTFHILSNIFNGVDNLRTSQTFIVLSFIPPRLSNRVPLQSIIKWLISVPCACASDSCFVGRLQCDLWSNS